MVFEQVIGQQEVQQRLMQMADEGRLPHAILLCGPQGCGKLALAVGFAQYLLSLNDQQPAVDMWGEPVPRQLSPMLQKLEHPDLHFTYPTIKLPSMMDSLYFTMNEWLEQMGGENQQAIITAGESDDLIRKLSLKSSQGGYKVSVVWLPERMNIECANKILKLLEEPPSQTVFLMVSEEPDRLLETIRSRVQRIDIKKIADADIQQALIDKRGLAEDQARRITRMANGNWLKALEMLGSDSENELFLDMFQTLMRLVYQRKVKDLKAWSERMASMGREKQKRFLEYFLRLIRENFMYNFHREELCYMTQREEDFAKNFARFINEDNILPITDLANLAIRDIGQNANGKIVFYDFALQMIVLLIQK